MSGTSEPSERPPAGPSPAEEARWWDEHKDYWDSSDDNPEGDVLVPGAAVRRTRSFSLRLPVDLVDSIEREARRRQVSSQVLIRSWIEERLTAVESAPAR